jgi:hypothetical protein
LHHLTIIVGRKSEIEGKHRDTGQGFGFISWIMEIKGY